MKLSVILLFMALLCYHPACDAAEPPAAYQTEADGLVKTLPSLYWYASDACLRETSRHGPQTIKYDAFVRDYRGVIEKATSLTSGEKPRAEYKMSLSDPKEPDEHWVFEFIYDGQKWEAKSGYKFFGKSRTFDLYEGSIFLGSMRPYVQRGLDAFGQRKNFSDVFPSKDSIPSQSAAKAGAADGTNAAGSGALPAQEDTQLKGAATSFKVGDIVEQYRHFEEKGFVAGQTEDFAGTKWKVSDIANEYVELELVEGRFQFRINRYEGPGFVIRFGSSNLYKRAFPKASPIQEVIDSFRKVDAAVSAPSPSSVKSAAKEQ